LPLLKSWWLIIENSEIESLEFPGFFLHDVLSIVCFYREYYLKRNEGEDLNEECSNYYSQRRQ